MPSKLYIPTTTLNFNNIMASESISPAGFYSVRGFGYKRFDKVEPNNLDNRIILYDKFPVFNINDKDLENYPLVIEVDMKTIGEGIIQEYKNGVYYSEETIYLNPFSTQFIFNNEIEKRSTLSKVEQSLNTKMVTVYQNSIIIRTPNIESFEWKNIDLTDSKNDFSKHISKDRKINKLKGFLYAYLLGANKSLPTDIVMLRKYAKELENVLSAIITSSDNRATYQQEKQIAKLYQSINIAFFKTDGKLQSILKQKMEQYKCMNFIEILREEGIWDYWCQKQNIKPQFHITQFYVSPSSSPSEKQIAFDNYISNVTNAIDRIVVSQNMKIDDLPIIQHSSRVECVQKNNFLPKLFNECLAENWNSEEFVSDRLEFATAGGKLFKEELKDKWENSLYKNYINDLRNNLASHTAFSLQNTDNLTLKSFAAFCQKGEENIDKLEDYLILNEIGDFRIAFALWGIIFGFANMPKTLTNDLFLSSDTDYISSIYKFIFNQIHGIELNGTLERKREFVTISSKINEKQVDNKIIESPKISLLEQELSDFKEFISRDKAIQKEIITKLSKLGICSLADWNDEKIDSITWASNKGQKALMTAIRKKIKNNTKPKRQPIRQQSPTLELFESSGNFLSDFDFLSNNSNFISIVSKHKNWKEDLKWFIDEYNNPNSRYYKGKSRENKEVIRKFIYLKDNKYKETETFLQKLYLLNE